MLKVVIEQEYQERRRVSRIKRNIKPQYQERIIAVRQMTSVRNECRPQLKIGFVTTLRRKEPCEKPNDSSRLPLGFSPLPSDLPTFRFTAEMNAQALDGLLKAVTRLQALRGAVRCREAKRPKRSKTKIKFFYGIPSRSRPLARQALYRPRGRKDQLRRGEAQYPHENP